MESIRITPRDSTVPTSSRAKIYPFGEAFNTTGILGAETNPSSRKELRSWFFSEENWLFGNTISFMVVFCKKGIERYSERPEK